MDSVAKSLRRQAQLLVQIGDDNELKGKYASKLSNEAGDLEKHLREVASRYERVHGHLKRWADDLEDYQDRADRILANAKREQEEADAAKKKEQSSEEKEASRSDDDPLKEYRKQLETVKGERDESAAGYATQIGREIKDIIRDSWWEDAVPTIKIVIDALSWAATIIGLVALLITPVGWVAMLATIATALVMAGHVLLAVTGDGSWMDVAMDAFSLVTMGMGARALAGLKGIQKTMRTLSARGAAKNTEKAVRNAEKVAQKRKELQRIINSKKAPKRQKIGAQKELARLGKSEQRAGKAARREEMQRDLPEAQSSDLRKAAGDQEVAQHYKDIQRMRAEHPGNTRLQEASVGAEEYKLNFQQAFAMATTADLADKNLGTSDIWEGKPYLAPYNDFKESFTGGWGSEW
ncbi:hypothetical protein [Streptomyces sp. NPDC057794]|uniref:hypothetical protein n=1 Tax=Streptomyces sp. NPDC057794 TaxID=3346251 RepID=UPI00367C9944